MYDLRKDQLEELLKHITDDVQAIRALDLSVEDELERALDQSRRIMGSLAMFRSRLTKQPAYGPPSLRRAA